MGKVNIKPLGDNVLIEVVEARKQTEVGIYLPETASAETPQEGKVIAVGEGKEIVVKKGQSVIYRRYSGTDITVGEKKYVLVKSEDVLAIVE